MVVAQKKIGKINGAQETKGCREVKGQEEDEQWADGISQLVLKFAGCGISQSAKICRL